MFKVLDAFSGAGGFSLGFSLSGGYEVLGGIEIDKWASETFEYNHQSSKVLNQDIEKLSNKEIESFFPYPDIVLGGPPCQGFSVCNKNSGDPKDPKNSLFKEFIRIGQIFSPKIMIMENVPNLIKAKTHSNELVIEIIIREMENIGYNVYHDILEATDFGVPQIRKRLFVIASKKTLSKPFPSRTHFIDSNEVSLLNFNLKNTPTLWDAISDLPELEPLEGNEIMEYETNPLNDYQKMLRNNSNLVFNHKSMKHSKRVINRFASMTWGDSVSDVPDHLKPYKRNSKEISEKIYDQNNRRMHPFKPCHTVPASFYANFVHPYKHRNFTAREGARIQSFPDWFLFKGKPTVVSHKLLQREGRDEEKHLCQYSQIGNAVPPLLAKAIADNLKGQL